MNMEMPTPCDCGKIFDLHDGHPCHACNKVFCRECAEFTEDGWRCKICYHANGDRFKHLRPPSKGSRK